MPSPSRNRAPSLIRCRRIYEARDPTDGYRVLADRLWPRGVSRDKAQIDAWEKDIAPSNALRRWYDHRPERWDEFQLRYRNELDTPAAAAVLQGLRERAQVGAVTLLTAARHDTGTHLTVLADLLKKQPR